MLQLVVTAVTEFRIGNNCGAYSCDDAYSGDARYILMPSFLGAALTIVMMLKVIGRFDGKSIRRSGGGFSSGGGGGGSRGGGGGSRGGGGGSRGGVSDGDVAAAANAASLVAVVTVAIANFET
ncbi:Hypothetical predicted protein [Octopus vulgaris]|uniref:Uncharacterized protein n=1 Tax=Octopus vulgaris TaxID=6645 RepID=A0AA36BCK3_OCTVU|nr:Hypothetical predicted protein [Octopus vulgaris]